MLLTGAVMPSVYLLYVSGCRCLGDLDYGRHASALISAGRAHPTLDGGDLLFGETVEVVDQPVDFPFQVGGISIGVGILSIEDLVDKSFPLRSLQVSQIVDWKLLTLVTLNMVVCRRRSKHDVQKP